MNLSPAIRDRDLIYKKIPYKYSAWGPGCKRRKCMNIVMWISRVPQWVSTGLFTDSGYIEKLFTFSIFELSLLNNKDDNFHK